MTEPTATENTRSSGSPVDLFPPAAPSGRAASTRRTTSRDSQPPSPTQETETAGSEILIEGNQNAGGTSSPNQMVAKEAGASPVISAPTIPVTPSRKKSVVENSDVFTPPQVVELEKISNGIIRPEHWRIENGRPVLYPADKKDQPSSGEPR